ncbi:SNF2 helicase associated domain-containing protein [candidate division KSB1 bacterium]|nr:SNF2 helicase associated domain-containing protein [candidate division KSB1 bacterium]
MQIEIEKIIQIAGHDIYRRGLQYYKTGRVNLVSIELDKFKAMVKGSFEYDVNVQKLGERLYASCSCPYWTTCKHVVAALLEAREWYEHHEQDLLKQKAHPEWRQFFKQVYEETESDHNVARRFSQKWKIIYLLNFDRESWSISPQKGYVKKSGELGRLSNVGEFNPESENLIYAPNDPIIIPYLQRLEQQSNSFYDYRYYGGYKYYETALFHFKYGSRVGPLFDFLSESDIYFKTSNGNMDRITISPDVCTVAFEFVDRGDSYRLLPKIKISQDQQDLDQKYRILTENSIWILQGHTLYKVDNFDNAGLLVPFTKEKIELSIPKKDFPVFLQDIYPQMTDKNPIPLPDSIPVEDISDFSEKRLYFKEGEKHLEIYLKFIYGKHEIDFYDTRQEIYRDDGDSIARIKRNREAEKKAWDELIDTGLKKNVTAGLRILESKAIDWLFDHQDKLIQSGYVFINRDNFKKFHIRTGAPSVKIAVSSQIDWFDLNMEIDIEGVLLSLKELRKSLFHHKRIVKLTDGSIARLDDEWYQKFQHLFNFTHVEDEKIKFPQYHVTLIDQLFEQATYKSYDHNFQKSLEMLGQFKGIKPKKLPAKLKNILRPYQKAGYDWLYFLKEFTLGGCLADDMGLGKTLQALALLLNEKSSVGKTSLIVCPTSVVFNWEQEIVKFTPSLRVLIHTGMEREKEPKIFEKYDIVLTSYGIMRRDIVFLREFRFHYIILDESQKIKNPQSQTGKACRLLNANHRLVLTGTPVENSTIELWSQISFLNPGLLGSLHYFKHAFTTPIEKKGDSETLALLKKIIFPFILRRTKEGVAKELPPKIEQSWFCAMNPIQEKLYNYWRNYYRAKILQKIDDGGMNRARFNVLQGLVKLRQIACHPHLVDQAIHEDSGKFESLKELIEEIIAENHKVLLYSQFVKMLSIIRQYFEKKAIIYEYLDGHTVNRRECVERFQTDDNVKIFLISLKAGGVGLNLTAADYVIHYDPWWNPAVEVQATDRAHRIGQDKKVFVYRLLTKNSVEEKILELQKKKNFLVSNLITTDSGFFKSLTRQDVEILFS